MDTKPRTTPPLNDEAELNKLISLARKQALSELESGKASSQVLTHFLKLGTVREEMELQKIILETRLVEAKIESERNKENSSNSVEAVLSALRSYSASTPNINTLRDYD